MSDHITTYTGEYFYPANPDPEGIHIKDIAHALSMICRGNGHVKTFFLWASTVSGQQRKRQREDIQKG